MMGEDLGIEAKEAAVREVAKLLPLPELLQSIASIKADYITRQQANDAQLSTMVAEQVEQAQAGLESLSLSEKTINHLRENFVSIEKLCQECQTLIENHDQIKILSNARNNLNTTLKDVEGMMSISVEAAEARDSLSDDKELINTYERLTALDGKRRFALAAAGSHKEEVGRLSSIPVYLDMKVQKQLSLRIRNKLDTGILHLSASVLIALGGLVYEVPLWVEKGPRVIFQSDVVVERGGGGGFAGVPEGPVVEGGRKKMTRVGSARGLLKCKKFLINNLRRKRLRLKEVEQWQQL
ncbi:hypothetical protein C3L33_20076, partial [Rhododendron williamsianum]